jgi:Chain length determinant protein
MEIVDFLRAARRRLWLIILLPLISAGAAAAVLLVQPTTYIATATVDPAALVGSIDSQYTGAQGVNQFVSAFQATASGPVVRRSVEGMTGVSATALNNGLTVVQRGTSASVAVNYTSDKKDTVSDVVEATTTLTLKALFSTQVELAKTRDEDARAALTEASAAIGAFTAKNKMADPQKAYEATLSRVNSMVQQQASLRAGGNAVAAAAMASTITAAKAELDVFGPILNEYNALLSARNAAVTAVTTADAALSKASAQLQAADPAKIVFVGGPRIVDRVEPLARTTSAVAAAAFFLSLLLVLMLEVMGRGRTARHEAASAASPRAAAAVAHDETPAPAVEPGSSDGSGGRRHPALSPAAESRS